MARVVLLVFALFLLLTVLRGLRIFLHAFFRGGRPGPPARGRGAREEEMVRDPVCGTWVDRRLALPARRGGETVAVCSEQCRRSLEAAG
jgi:YHS domain-containing protein